MASGGLRLDGHAAVGAVLHAELHEQQAQERVDLGERGHGALPAAPAGALLDGHRRRHAVDAVHVGPAGRLHELPRVGVQRFEVPALSFGEEDVEGDRALAAAAHAGDHAEGVPGDGQVDVLEVVLPRVADDDGVVRDAREAARALSRDAPAPRRAGVFGAAPS